MDRPQLQRGARPTLGRYGRKLGSVTTDRHRLDSARACSDARHRPQTPSCRQARSLLAIRGVGVRILLVDDNPFDRELAARALRRLDRTNGPAELVAVNDWSEAGPHLVAGGFDLL